MQVHLHVGRVAAAPEVRGTVCKFTLLSDEFAGRDGDGEALEELLSIQFTAFGKNAKRIAENVCKGDQLIVEFRMKNNNYQKEGVTHYGYDFIVERYQNGAPGKEKRQRFAEQNED